ncbi:MAG TPA: hypothetical protein PLD03_06985 [Thiomonas arsenitoxydans]|jgi:hypothetical protein|nr:hypothetical protein [Thiomonas arsenitoxydans]
MVELTGMQKFGRRNRHYPGCKPSKSQVLQSCVNPKTWTRIKALIQLGSFPSQTLKVHPIMKKIAATLFASLFATVAMAQTPAPAAPEAAKPEAHKEMKKEHKKVEHKKVEHKKAVHKEMKKEEKKAQ